jgi:hypothetical protein
MNTFALLVVLCAVLLVIGILLAGSMNIGALIFMLCAWAVVLGILVWSFARLLRLPPPGNDHTPPPDSGP